MLIGPEGQIKLTGFGTAQAQALLSDPATLLRTVPYSPPDVVQGRGATQSGDLYSLGVTLFEMLTGETPYSGDSPIQIALKHAQEPIPSPRVLNAGVPRALEGIVQKLLGKRPDERYLSAAALLDDLRAVRDALRYGKSLSWAPQDRVGREETGTVAAVAGAGDPLDRTMIMPAAKGAIAYPPRHAAKEAVVAEAPSRENRWLTTVNLVLLILVIGACSLFAWTILNFLKPVSEVVVPNLVG